MKWDVFTKFINRFSNFFQYIFLLFLGIAPLLIEAHDRYVPRFEGLLGAPRSDVKNLHHLAPYFLVYNPIVVEVGAYKGANTCALANKFPYGTVIAFEPNPTAFEEMGQKVQNYPSIKAVQLALSDHQGTTSLYLENSLFQNSSNSEENASILQPSKKARGSSKSAYVTVSCATLDDWCQANGVDHIDFLQLDASGSEYPILLGASRILRTVQVICTRTYFRGYWNKVKEFQELNDLLRRSGFEMLSHWYFEGLYGEAVFIRTEIYHALYQ